MILLNIALFCITIFLLVFSILIEKHIVNPLTSFLFLWIIIISFSSMNLFGLQSTEAGVYTIFLSGMICFSISYIFRNEVAHYNSKKHMNKIKNYVLREKLFQFLGFIIILKLAFDFVTLVSTSGLTFDLSIIRETAQNNARLDNQNTNAIMNSLNIFIFEPFSLLFPIVVLVEFWKGNKNKLLILELILIVSLRIITTGGRSSLINLTLGFIFLYFFNRGNVKIHPFVKFLLVGIFVFFFILTTLSRSNDNALETLYYYFAMEPLMFEKWVGLSQNQIGNTIFLSSLNGFFFPIFYLLKNIFNFPFPALFFDAYNITQIVDSNWQIIAKNGIAANAYVSMFFFLYYDFGFLGVMIGNFLYGGLINKVYINAKINLNSKNLTLYVFLMIGLLNSFVRLQFVNIFHALAIIYIFMIYKKEVIDE